jgi:hypothetical protein
MNEKMIFFSQTEGTLLIRLLMAHIVADFMLQTTKMVNQKKWFSKNMLLHISIVFVVTVLLCGNLVLAAAIAISHWIIDAAKATIQGGPKKIMSGTALFAADQLLHILSILLLWSLVSHHVAALIQAAKAPFINYKCSMILLGYAFITTPIGYIIETVTAGMNSPPSGKNRDIVLVAQETFDHLNTDKVKHGGKLIGIFERIIILTLVLLGQYSAIGFLITGKSIIRFANNDEHLRSEYVLVGTMMSYALAIMTGACINWLLAL